MKQELQSINKKIVIIVDDLDRLDLPTIKDVLYVIKNAFTLPNISFVLCYDTDKEIDNLTLENVCGKYIDYIKSKI